MPGLFGKAKSLFNDEVEQWKRSFNLLGGIPKTFKNNPRNAETMDAVFGFGGIVPGVGDAASVIEAKYRYDQGDKLGAGLAGIGALPLVPNVAGMFIGKGAKTWDALKHAEALKMEQAGKHPRVIWAETGNWKAPDGMWRQEIPDNEAKIKGLTYQGREGIEGHGELTNFLNHNDMYAAYPDTGKIQSSLSQSAKAQEFGSYSNDGPAYSEFFPQLQVNAKNVKSPLLHELQHAIQQREGFARGGSPEAMRSVLSSDPLLQSAYSQPEPYDAYRRLLGEAEARATQARMNMDMPMRLAKFPEDSFDVPMDRLIVRYGDGPAMSTGRPRNHLGQEIPPTKYEQALEEARIDAWKNHGLPENNTAMERAKAMQYKNAGEDFYGIDHRPPMSYSGAPLHDLTGGGQVYPDDVYSGMASRYYGTGDPSDASLFAKIQRLKDKPDEKVVVYRAVPRDVMQKYGNTIHHGDWVTINRQYAVDHGEGALNGNYRIQRGEFPAKTLFTNGDSPYEYGLDRSQLFADAPADIPLMIGQGHSMPDRSRFAAFNMSKRDSPDLLAGFAPYAMPVGAGLLGSMYLLPREDMQ